MESFELNDHERVETIRRFLAKYGRLIVLLVVMAAILIAIEHFWRAHVNQVNADASESYQGLITSINNNAPPSVVAAQAKSLIDAYPKTTYANFARFFLAEQALNQSQPGSAEDYLRQVVEHSQGDLKALAKARLVRVLLSENRAEEALKFLAPAPKGYEALFQFLSADSKAMLGHISEARNDYQLALKNVGSNMPLRTLIVQHLSNLPEA